jgi:hypothetical protein
MPAGGAADHANSAVLTNTATNRRKRASFFHFLDKNSSDCGSKSLDAEKVSLRNKKMKTVSRLKTLALAAGSLIAMSSMSRADFPGKHPFYLHALTDLRTARWALEHRPGSARVSGHEDVAIQNIDAAIGELKRAAIEDGKDIHDHPAVDAWNDNPGRLHRAAELLRKVHSDVDREEDDPVARGLKHRALEHVDVALRETEGAIWDVEHGR